jgi:NAD(P)-dependent dehydrogenase (short-subunit alcohol dehydrogenase family)
MTERGQPVAEPAAEHEQPLVGRRAAIIGVEGAAGAAIARALGGAGADLALCALRADEGVLVARRVQRELRAAGRHAASYVMDVTLGRNVQVTTRQVAKELGGLDLVVSASLLPVRGALARLTEVEVAQILALNFSAHLFLVRSAAPELARAGGGTVLLLTHEAGSAGDPEAPLFAAAQAATLSLVTSLAAPLAEDGVTLAAIALAAPPSENAGPDLDEATRAGALAVELATAGLDAAGRVVGVTGGAG